MQFRCYTCGALFHDGMPPVTALSDTQAMFVFDDSMNLDEVERNLKSRSLDNTKFEGMSSGSFCEFCLLWIHEFPSATKDRASWEHTKAEVDATIGDVYADKHALINRYMVLKAAQELYKTHPLLDMLRELLFVGITYEMDVCQWPTCNEELGWSYPQRNGHSYCSRHHNPMRRRDRVWMYYNVHLFFNPNHTFSAYNYDSHDCKFCFKAWLDDQDSQWEAAEQASYEAKFTNPEEG